MAFRILSIDGGGLRGIIPVLILKHIEDLVRRERIVDGFDLVAGASTGGLIACGLTATERGGTVPRLGLSDLEHLYIERGQEIFPPGSRLKQWYRKRFWSYLGSPQFSANGLDRVLRETLNGPDGHEPRLLECYRPVFIPAYDIQAMRPVYFTLSAINDEPELNARLVDICRATSAGPTYLQPFRFVLDAPGRLRKGVAIDGGIFMNNPALGALVEVMKNHRLYGMEHFVPDEVFVLSIGTGRHSVEIANDAPRWGKLRWIEHVIDISMWGNAQAVHDLAQKGLTFAANKVNYLRINVDIDEKRFADMANATSDAMDYWRERVRLDYLNNADLLRTLDSFITKSGL